MSRLMSRVRALMTEHFAYVEGTDNRYLVSDRGRVYNVKTHRFLKPFRHDRRGWYSVSIVINGKRDNYKVHRLVAKAFIANPLSKPGVNHIDRNRANNWVWNLEWATDAENNDHRLGRVRSRA